MLDNKLTDLIADFSFDHTGIAVHSIEESLAFYKSLGLGSVVFEEVASEKVKVAILELNNSCRLDLLEPTSEDSPIAKFLQKRGPGIHHICLRVSDIQKVIANLKSAGVKLINEEPKLGAHNMLVVFVHPKSTGGVLLELSQPKSE